MRNNEFSILSSWCFDINLGKHLLSRPKVGFNAEYEFGSRC